MAFPRNSRFRSVYEPEDDFGSDEAFLQNVIAPAPVAAPAPPPAPIAAPAPDLTPAVVPEVNGLPDFSNMVNPFTGETFGSVDYAPLLKQAEEAQAKEKLISDLTGQLSSQWQEYGLDPSIKGINRANELAQILAHYGITDLSKLGIKETPYEEMRGGWQGGDAGEYIESLYKGNRGQLTYGDKTYGHLIGFGGKGQQEFLTRDPFEYLQDYGDQGYKLAGSAAGKGAVDYILLKDAQGNLRKDAQGRPVLIPQWRSTSDIGDIAPLLAVASFIPGVAPFAAAANAALSLSQGDVLGGVASLAGLGGFTDVANAARLASAVKNEDLLGAIMPGLGLAGVSDVGGFSTKDIGTAVNVARAIEKENPLALLGAASAYLPGPDMPGVIKDANIQEGFFEPGGPGFMPTEALSQEEVDRELRGLLARYPAPAAPSDWFPGENVPSGIPEWDYAAVTAGLPIGNLEQDFSVAQTKTGPQIVDTAGNVGTFVNGEFVPETGLTPSGGAPSAAPAPAAAPGKAPAPAAPKGPAFNPALLFGLSALMGQQQQKPQEQYQTARTVPSPFGMDLIL